MLVVHIRVEHDCLPCNALSVHSTPHLGRFFTRVPDKLGVVSNTHELDKAQKTHAESELTCAPGFSPLRRHNPIDFWLSCGALVLPVALGQFRFDRVECPVALRLAHNNFILKFADLWHSSMH
jgi:hypothetical protein